MTPYSVDYGVSVKEKKSLSEAGAQRHPARTARVVASLFDKDSSSLLCTHRPVLPQVMDVLRDYLLRVPRRFFRLRTRTWSLAMPWFCR